MDPEELEPQARAHEPAPTAAPPIVLQNSDTSPSVSGHPAGAALDQATSDLAGRQRSTRGPAHAPGARLTEDEIAHAAVLEQMTHGAAYLGGHESGGRVDTAEADEERNGLAPGEGQARTQMLEHNGYNPEPTVISGENGLQMVVYEPIAEGVAPVVAFRGTEEADDLVTDGDPVEIGNAQYDANREAIDAQMARLNEQYGQVEVTGHSLGGSVAQRTAADHLDQTESITTFQAPGVDTDTVARIEAYNAERVAAGEAPLEADHFQVNGCLVAPAGEAHAPGRLHALGLEHHARNVIGETGERLLGEADDEYGVDLVGRAEDLIDQAAIYDPVLPGGLSTGTNPYEAHTSFPLTAMALRTEAGREALGPEFETEQAAERWNDDVATVDTQEVDNSEQTLNEDVRSWVGHRLVETRDGGNRALEGVGDAQVAVDNAQNRVQNSVDNTQGNVDARVAGGQRTVDREQAHVLDSLHRGQNTVDRTQAALAPLSMVAPVAAPITNLAIDGAQFGVEHLARAGSGLVDAGQQAVSETVTGGQRLVNRTQQSAGDLVHRGQEAVSSGRDEASRQWAELWGALG